MKRLAILVLLAGGCKGDDPLSVIGPRVAPPHGLRLGMTIEEARVAVPKLGEGFGGAGSAGGSAPGAFLTRGAQLSLQVKDGRVDQIYLTFDPDHASESDVVTAVTERWGAPVQVRGVIGPAQEWRSEVTGWRATQFSHSTLRFTPYRPVTAGFFGTSVAPPGPISALRVGMTFAEAKAAVPDLRTVSDGSIAMADGGGDDLVASAFFDGERKIHAVSLELPSLAAATTMLTTAWKAGARGTDRNGKPTLTWSSPATGWRAELLLVESHRLDTNEVGEAAELQFSRL